MNANDLSLLECLAPSLLSWYAQNKRDLPWRSKTPDPYCVWVSEIMLQQTRVEAVKSYFIRFMEELPNVGALAAVEEDRLMRLWEGLGYYNRARSLQKAARIVMDAHGGRLPRTYEGLLSLPGIGPYTAGAVASIAFGVPVSAVDGNVLRVLSRILADFSDIALPETRENAKLLIDTFLQTLPPDAPGKYNQALMELGAVVCVPNGPPKCGACPAAAFCRGMEQDIMLDLPIKTAKKPRRVEDRTVLLLSRDGKAAVRRRPEKGLLAGLWELPNLPGSLDPDSLNAAVRKIGLEPIHIKPLGTAKHIFTHVEWHMEGFLVTVEEALETGGLAWVDPHARSGHALPSAFKVFLQRWLG